MVFPKWERETQQVMALGLPSVSAAPCISSTKEATCLFSSKEVSCTYLNKLEKSHFFKENWYSVEINLLFSKIPWGQINEIICTHTHTTHIQHKQHKQHTLPTHPHTHTHFSEANTRTFPRADTSCRMEQSAAFFFFKLLVASFSVYILLYCLTFFTSAYATFLRKKKIPRLPLSSHQFKSMCSNMEGLCELS